jgi:hypothetical protein
VDECTAIAYDFMTAEYEAQEKSGCSSASLQSE